MSKEREDDEIDRVLPGDLATVTFEVRHRTPTPFSWRNYSSIRRKYTDENNEFPGDQISRSRGPSDAATDERGRLGLTRRTREARTHESGTVTNYQSRSDEFGRNHYRASFSSLVLRTLI